MGAIEVRGLVREFKKGPRAVDGIDITVAEGEIYGFLGPNGAGKSTTVLMLTTLLPPTAGTATVAGFDIVRQGAEVRGAIGAALQEAALDKFLTGREHLKLQGVGLMEAADRKVGGYSGGMKRRLDLALALLHGPRVLFLDEPTTGLDPQSRTALWDEVARLSREDGVTVFLTTQYLEEADALANRVGIIDHGHIVIEGTPDELKASVGRSSVEIEPHDAARLPDLERALAPFGTAIATRGNSASIRLDEGVGDVAAIVRALDSTGIAIHQLRLREPTLDDVFLEQTGRSLEGSGGASDEDGAEQ
jgi:ABC-2 type transport system ATP-binding protein